MNRPLLLVLFLLANGCAILIGGPGAGGRTPRDLAQARARWERAGLDDYTFTLQRNCFCPEEYRGPFEVQVENDRIVRVTREGQPADQHVAQVPTIEELFGLLEGAYAGSAERVVATYDAALGYPVEFFIDESTQIADEEIGYHVPALTPR
ncbi:MAG TPA: DUF6174 domain-containing protein [Rubricoccaceae bacterium]|nr:DUF6174 domain-containing protein [Rubricoccaceae bacterium]